MLGMAGIWGCCKDCAGLCLVDKYLGSASPLKSSTWSIISCAIWHAWKRQPVHKLCAAEDVCYLAVVSVEKGATVALRLGRRAVETRKSSDS